jgi:hypothetical protein
LDTLGIYVAPNQKPECRPNISNLSPNAWSLASEDMRYQVGARHEHFIKQGINSGRFSLMNLVRVKLMVNSIEPLTCWQSNYWTSCEA